MAFLHDTADVLFPDPDPLNEPDRTLDIGLARRHTVSRPALGSAHIRHFEVLERLSSRW
jgi:hypothetical protein